MKNNNLKLPDIDKVCEKYHEDWMKTKQAAGIQSKVNSDGEELMKPFNELTDKAKEYTRNVVNGTYNAIQHVAEAEQVAEGAEKLEA